MRNKQSGQAMIELALMILLMTFATLGMLMVCAMADYADETFLESRHNAEMASRNSTEKIKGEEYSTWMSPTSKAPYSGMNIPFNLEEKPTTGINPIGSFGENLNSAEHSVPVTESYYDQYKKLNKYHRLADFDGEFFKNDFYDKANDENMFAAASLVQGAPHTGNDNPLTRVISRSGHNKGARINHDPNKSYNALLRAFTKLFGVDFEDAGRKIKKAPSTSVYMPITENTTE